MPSREEIAGWLREAALIVDYTVAIDTPGPIKKSVFHQRASQVEAMRCENCSYYQNPVQNLGWCEQHQERFHPGEGCFFWELKEK